MSSSSRALLLVVGLLAAAVGLALVPTAPRRSGVSATAPVDAGTAAAPPTESPRAADAMPPVVRHVVVGGGPAPDGNEVEIERTVAAAAQALGEDTVVLFAGGADTRSVQVEDGPIDGDPLLAELGALFSPRSGRRARYRATTLPRVHGAADVATIEPVLEEALAGEGLLDLVLIGHGSAGDFAADTAFLAWGGVGLDAPWLAELLGEEPPRPVRVIATHCHGGGLAELAFVDADPERGPTAADRCGLFATTWDREAAGCDADPARRSDGWSAHFFAALAGRAPDGTVPSGLDLDGDGAISGLEAHARARIASRSIDVPTSTSSRLLRAIAPRSGPEAALVLPDEEAVRRALGEAIDEHAAHEAEARAGELEASLGDLFASRQELEAESDAAWTALTSALLSRWPVLDDPFHPAFAGTLAEDREAIERFLASSSAKAELDAAIAQLDALAAAEEGLELELALVQRYLDADETITLAARLRAVGGAGWARYERMRACEAGVL